MGVLFGLGYGLLGSLTAAAGLDIALLVGLGFQDNYPRWLPFCAVLFLLGAVLCCVLLWLNVRLLSKRALHWSVFAVEVSTAALTFIPGGALWVHIFSLLRAWI